MNQKEEKRTPDEADLAKEKRPSDAAGSSDGNPADENLTDGSLTDERPADKEKSLEERFAELDAMAEMLERPDVSLEESFSIYKKGMEVLKSCNDAIDKVEKKMLQIGSDGELSEF